MKKEDEKEESEKKKEEDEKKEEQKKEEEEKKEEVTFDPKELRFTSAGGSVKFTTKNSTAKRQALKVSFVYPSSNNLSTIRIQ